MPARLNCWKSQFDEAIEPSIHLGETHLDQTNEPIRNSSCKAHPLLIFLQCDKHLHEKFQWHEHTSRDDILRRMHLHVRVPLYLDVCFLDWSSPVPIASHMSWSWSSLSCACRCDHGWSEWRHNPHQWINDHCYHWIHIQGFSPRDGCVGFGQNSVSFQWTIWIWNVWIVLTMSALSSELSTRNCGKLIKSCVDSDIW